MAESTHHCLYCYMILYLLPPMYVFCRHILFILKMPAQCICAVAMDYKVVGRVVGSFQNLLCHIYYRLVENAE